MKLGLLKRRREGEEALGCDGRKEKRRGGGVRMRLKEGDENRRCWDAAEGMHLVGREKEGERKREGIYGSLQSV